MLSAAAAAGAALRRRSAISLRYASSSFASGGAAATAAVGSSTPSSASRELRAMKELHEVVFSHSARHAPPPPITSPDFLPALARELQAQDLGRLYSPHSLSRILANLGKADFNDAALFDKFALLLLADSALPERFSPHDVSLICSGFASLGIQDYILFSKLARDIQHQLATRSGAFNAADLVRIAIAFTQLRFGDPELFEALSKAIQNKDTRQFTVSELAHIARTFSTMGFKFPEVFAKISRHMCTHSDLKQFNSRDLVMTLQSFAKYGKPNALLFDKLIREMDARNMAEFDNKSIKAILWSLETMNFLHFDLFHKLWREFDRRSPHDPYEF